MTTDLINLSWSLSNLGEAIQTLSRKSGLGIGEAASPIVPDIAGNDPSTISDWIETTANCFGIEAAPVECSYAEVERFITNIGPAILQLPGNGPARFLAIIDSRANRLSIISPDLSAHSIDPAIVRTALCIEHENPILKNVDQLLNQAGVARRRLVRARTAVLRERLRQKRIGGCWLLRPSIGACFWRQMQIAQLPRKLLTMTGSYALQYLFVIAAWWLLGQGVLNGRLERGWLLAWALLLLSTVPLRLLTTWSQGLFAIGVGGLMKQRLLLGALRLETEEVRHQGIGQALGRIIESNALESLALTGGFLAVVALIEIGLAVIVLGLGAGGWTHSLMLILWALFALLIGWRLFRRRGSWTEERLKMTNDLIERMVGHRTRLAQEVSQRWHDTEDQATEQYLQQSCSMDKVALMQSIIPRGWLVFGLVGLWIPFVSGNAPAVTMAVSIGGLLLAFLALEKLVEGLQSILSAGIAWKQVARLFKAASRKEETGSPEFALQVERIKPQSSFVDEDCNSQARARVVIETHDLAFRYSNRAEPILRGCNLKIHEGDRLLLEGSSGGGKSTLASLLTGLRGPQSGLLLLDGLDYKTLGATAWRRRIVSAPQFHENHIITGTFAFNLLMGRAWPPTQADLAEAETVCRELGLSDLLSRMPGGLLQMVGETGWQLSHGERSRLFLARTLLQKADLVILDESFGALDPENLGQCLRATFNRANMLLVIAHP